MRLLNVTNAPIYLPGGKASLPFGDPLSDVTCTSASPGVLTAPGYNAPVNGDRVSLSVSGAGVIPTGLTAGVPYFVVGVSGVTFQLSLTAGGAAINTSSTGTAPITLHLLSAQNYGPSRLFKPGSSAVCLNLTAGSLVLQGAADSNTGFGNPGGPGSYSTIATVGAGAAALVDLSYDWIRVSTAATLVLLQN